MGAASDESFSLVSLAAEHGYSFTAEEAQSAWDAAQEGELSDIELDVVSGGAISSNDTDKQVDLWRLWQLSERHRCGVHVSGDTVSGLPCSTQKRTG